MYSPRKERVRSWLRDTPLKQIEKNTFIRKTIILAIVVCLVVIPSLIVYLIIYKKLITVKDAVWYENKVFWIVPDWNDIKETYPIWGFLASKTNQWLIVVQLCVMLFGIVFLAGSWLYIENKTLFFCVMVMYVSLMFNWIDASIGGKAFDYISIKPEYGWLKNCLMWPVCIPLWLSGKEAAAQGACNLPDIFFSLSLITTIFVALALLIEKTSFDIKVKKLNKVGIYI